VVSFVAVQAPTGSAAARAQVVDGGPDTDRNKPGRPSTSKRHREEIFMSGSFPVQMKPASNFCHDEFQAARAGYVRSGDRKIVIHSPEFLMIEFAKTWLALTVDRRAVTALEYGLIAGVIVATITVGFSILANSLSESFSAIGDSL